MAFKKPERPLTKREWDTLTDAAFMAVGIYRSNAESLFDRGLIRAGEFYVNKADKISQTIIDLENEYYEKHPEEDPDRIIT